MKSTMSTLDLGTRYILDYGSNEFPESRVISYYQDFVITENFRSIASRAARLANALHRLGAKPPDRVATFCFNHNQHLEAYLGIPSMGCVVHTLNLRLFPEQLAYVMNDAEDKIVIVDNIVAPLLFKVLKAVKSLEHLIMIGPPVAPDFLETLHREAPGINLWDYEELIASESDTYPWPHVPEHEAAMMCYTSGTTGAPKGVVYSHRSIYMHAFGTKVLYSRAFFYPDKPEKDIALIVVPMFHAAAWGTPFACWLTGADMIMPTRFLQAEPLAHIISEFRPTVSAGVPTIWNDLFHYLEEHPVDMSCLRFITSGGSATPRSLIEGYLDRYGVPIMSGWGMTETSPVCTLAVPPPGTPRERLADYLETAGKAIAGVELRICGEDGKELARDGQAIGEVEVRGSWITAGYYHDDSDERFHDGWLRTGDMGTISAEGYLKIVDRSKDMIKSGGEWISSIELENAIMSHPSVLEAAVIGVPDERWVERPLAVIVKRPEQDLSPEELAAFLTTRVAKWWIPEKIAFLDNIPRTSVGKFDKKALRQLHVEDKLQVIARSIDDGK